MMTPLHYAADNGNVNIIRLLLSKGADLTALDEDNQTPLMISEICGHEVSMILTTFFSFIQCCIHRFVGGNKCP